MTMQEYRDLLAVAYAMLHDAKTADDAAEARENIREIEAQEHRVAEM